MQQPVVKFLESLDPDSHLSCRFLSVNYRAKYYPGVVLQGARNGRPMRIIEQDIGVGHTYAVLDSRVWTFDLPTDLIYKDFSEAYAVAVALSVM